LCFRAERLVGLLLPSPRKGGRRREVGIDRWPFEQLDPWLEIHRRLPVGSLFCVLRGPTRGRPCRTPAIRVQLRDTAAKAGVRRRFAVQQLRHAHAVKMSREGVPLVVIQRQLGHTNLGVTSVYLRGIDNTEIIQTVHDRPAPVISASDALRIDPRTQQAPAPDCGEAPTPSNAAPARVASEKRGKAVSRSAKQTSEPSRSGML
jgi:hypothetical protein